MATALKNLSEYTNQVDLSAENLKFAIAVSEWNEEITTSLLSACIDTLKEHGVSESNISVANVPGTYELPMACKMLIQNKAPNAVIALGCVIQGETKHDDYINHAVSSGLIQLSLLSNIPCVYGVVTTNNLQQALDRSGGKHGNKGVESAITAIRMAKLSSTIKGTSSKIGF